MQIFGIVVVLGSVWLSQRAQQVPSTEKSASTGRPATASRG